MPLSPGDKIGHYDVLSLLGRGGVGEVYRARDTQLKRDVALKVLSAAFSSDPERLARFQREVEALAQLKHPNIATIFGLEQSVEPGTPWVEPGTPWYDPPFQHEGQNR
jgi:serine/threonine protein kinase